ncbi:uncharacterized protein SPAPADRAFT_62501 [Spathaspora passalidarum NRRL Y-27907]|uniref:CFEM domain-containing protein n=1 Tax=Spathaspora passalidarum (strain NRRL Y-27907 / 11-Y1) TaxID=619300 RepID=G3ASA1_SPAPN|nr:uncharacterized protein SPAPADRAFT_62501 [Spathaspora passalidarum NRRL Y-27907]EGW30641.1 hypothetical protein SPAPADRAFT_62501 [Spathaspora passalidarum NRRL Y-27907]
MYALIPLFSLILLVSAANPYETFPKVPKTASINGFADPIIDLLPECAKDCVKISTGNTPCPYWDTGCFCVMPQWAGLMGQCVAKNCQGRDVASARYLATSLCNAVGAGTVIMPESISDALSSAAGGAKDVTTIEGKTAKSWVIASGSSEVSKTADPSAKSSDSASTDAKTTSNESKTTNTSEQSETQSQTSASETSETKSNLGVYATTSLAALFVSVILSLFI